MEKYKQCKYLIITDKKTRKKYSFPQKRGFECFEDFVEENDPASKFWYIHFEPLSSRWYLVSTVNGFVDFKLKRLAKRFSVSAIH